MIHTNFISFRKSIISHLYALFISTRILSSNVSWLITVYVYKFYFKSDDRKSFLSLLGVSKPTEKTNTTKKVYILFLRMKWNSNPLDNKSFTVLLPSVGMFLAYVGYLMKKLESSIFACVFCVYIVHVLSFAIVHFEINT